MTLPAFCIARTFPPEPPVTHRFDRHYLLYALKGTMRLEAEGRCWSLPPARAAWIAAGAPITVALARPVEVCSLLFAPEAFAAPAAALTVFEITPLLREVIRALRDHGPEATDLPTDARLLFETAAMLAARLSETPSRAVMPAGQSAPVRRALAATDAAIDAPPGFAALADGVGMTPRTLARRFQEELGMNWRQALQRLRMIRACEALAEGDTPVTEVALSVGYASPSAFNAAFRAFAGVSPGEWRSSAKGA